MTQVESSSSRSCSLARKCNIKNNKWGRKTSCMTVPVEHHSGIYGSIFVNPWISGKNTEVLTFYPCPPLLSQNNKPKQKSRSTGYHQQPVTSKTFTEVCKKICWNTSWNRRGNFFFFLPSSPTNPFLFKWISVKIYCLCRSNGNLGW